MGIEQRPVSQLDAAQKNTGTASVPEKIIDHTYRTNDDVIRANGFDPAVCTDSRRIRERVYNRLNRNPDFMARSVKTIDPKDGKRKYFFPEDVFEELVRSTQYKAPAQKKHNSRQNSTSDNKDGEPNNKDNHPFRDEHDRRAMLGKTKEGIRKELGIDLTTIFLSHLATDNMKKLTKDPREFLENLLPRPNNITKIRLSLVINEPEEQFLFNEFEKRVKALWAIENIRSTDSVLQKRVIGHCLDLKKNGYTLQSTIDTFCAHFPLPIPTSSPAL